MLSLYLKKVIMSSVVSIVNQALDRIGEYNAITDLSDSSKQAIVANRNYAIVRDWCLRQADWNFAKKRVILAASATAPAFVDNGQSYFPKPADCLRILSINDDLLSEYDEEAEGILYYGTSLKLLYVARIEDTSKFDPLFEEFVVSRLAEVMSATLTDAAEKRRMLSEDRVRALSNARTVHSMERGHRTVGNSRFIASRYNGNAG